MFSRNTMNVLGLLIAAMLGLVVATPSAMALDNTWTNTGGGNWSTLTNWADTSAYPNAAGDIARIIANIGADKTVSIDAGVAGSGVTLGSLYIDDDGSKYNISAATGKTLTFDTGLGATSTSILDGGRKDVDIQASVNIILMNNLLITKAGSTAYLQGNISMGEGLTGLGITKEGAGTATLRGVNTFDGSLTVTAGTLNLENNGAGGTNLAHTVNGGMLRLSRPSALAAGSVVTVNSTGNLQAYYIPVISSVTAVLNNGGKLEGDNGELAGWLGDVQVQTDAAGVTFRTTGSDKRFRIGSAGKSISGGGESTLLKIEGDGVIELNVANTVRGTWTMNSGTSILSISADNQLGNAANDITVNNNVNNARLRATEDVTLGAGRVITVNNTGNNDTAFFLEAMPGKTLTLGGTAGQVVLNTTYSGKTSRLNLNGGGTVALSGDATIVKTGSANTELAVMNDTTLLLDNSTTNVADRIADAIPVTMRGGNLTLLGMTDTPVAETLGALKFDRIQSTVTSTPGSGSGTNALTFASLARTANNSTSATAKFVGDGITFTGTVGGMTNNILPWAFVGSEFASVDSATSKTIMAAGAVGAKGQYVALAGADTTSNVKLDADTQLAAAQAINSLHMGGFNLDLSNGVDAGYLLTLGSPGGLISTGTDRAISSSFAGGKIGATNELIAYVDGNLTLSAPLSSATAFSLVKTGPGLLRLLNQEIGWGSAKWMVINEGTVSVADANAFGATAQVTLGQDATLKFDGLSSQLTLTKQVNLGYGGGGNYGAGGIIDVQSGPDVMITSKITGGPGNDITALTKTGDGNLILANNTNDFIGNIRILGGTLTAAASTNQTYVFGNNGNGANDIYIDNATLSDLYSLDFGSGKTITIGSNGATFNTAASKETKFNDPEQLRTVGSPNLTKTGAGSLTIDWTSGNYGLLEYCGLSNDASFNIVDIQAGPLNLGGLPSPRLEAAGDFAQEVRLTGATSQLKVYSWSQPTDVRPYNQKIAFGAGSGAAATWNLQVNRQWGTAVGDVEFKDLIMEEGSELVVDEANTRVLVDMTLKGNATVGKTGGDDIEVKGLVSDVAGTARTLSITEGQILGIRGGWSTDVTLNVVNGSADLRTDLDGLLTSDYIINVSAATGRVIGRVVVAPGAGDPPLATYGAAIRFGAAGGTLRQDVEGSGPDPSVGVVHFTNVTLADTAQVLGEKGAAQNLLVADLKLEGNGFWGNNGTGNAAIGSITGLGGAAADHVLTVNTAGAYDNRVLGALTNANIVYAPGTASRTLFLGSISAGAGAYESSFTLGGNKVTNSGTTTTIAVQTDVGAGTIDSLLAGQKVNVYAGSSGTGGLGAATVINVGDLTTIKGYVLEVATGNPMAVNTIAATVNLGATGSIITADRTNDATIDGIAYFPNVNVPAGADFRLERVSSSVVADLNLAGSASAVNGGSGTTVSIGDVTAPAGSHMAISGTDAGTRRMNLVGKLNDVIVDINASSAGNPTVILGDLTSEAALDGGTKKFDLNGGTINLNAGTLQVGGAVPGVPVPNRYFNPGTGIVNMAGTSTVLDVFSGADGTAGQVAGLTINAAANSTLKGRAWDGVVGELTVVNNITAAVNLLDAGGTYTFTTNRESPAGSNGDTSNQGYVWWRNVIPAAGSTLNLGSGDYIGSVVSVDITAGDIYVPALGGDRYLGDVTGTGTQVVHINGASDLRMLGKLTGADLEVDTTAGTVWMLDRTSVIGAGSVFDINGRKLTITAGTVDSYLGSTGSTNTLEGGTIDLTGTGAIPSVLRMRVSEVPTGSTPLTNMVTATINAAGTSTLNAERNVDSNVAGTVRYTNVVAADGLNLNLSSSNSQNVMADLDLSNTTSGITLNCPGDSRYVGNVKSTAGLKSLILTGTGNLRLAGQLQNTNVIGNSTSGTLYLTTDPTDPTGATGFSLGGNTLTHAGRFQINLYVDPGLGTIDMTGATTAVDPSAVGDRLYLMYKYQMGSLLPGEGWGDDTTVLVSNKTGVFLRADDTPVVGERNWNRFNGPVVVKTTVADDYGFLSASRQTDMAGGSQAIFQNVQVDEGATAVLDQDNARMIAAFNQQLGANGFVKSNDDGDMGIAGVRGNGSITIVGALNGSRNMNFVGPVTGSTATLIINDTTSTGVYSLRGANIDWPDTPGFDVIDGGTLKIARSGSVVISSQEVALGSGSGAAGHVVIGDASSTATPPTLEVRRGDDGTVPPTGANVDFTLQYGGTLRGYVQHGTATAITQNFTAPVIVTNADSDAATADGALASAKSAAAGQGSLLGTVQFSNVTLGNDSRLRLDAFSGENLLLSSVTVAGGNKAAIVNSSSDTLVRMRDTGGTGDLVLTGYNVTRLGGALTSNKIIIGEGWDTFGSVVSGGKAMIDEATDVTGMGTGFDVMPGAELTIAAAITGSKVFDVKGDATYSGGTLFVRDAGFNQPVLLGSKAAIVLQSDASTGNVTPGTDSRFQIDMPIYAGNLIVNSGASATSIGLRSRDATILNAITGDAETLTFMDAQTDTLSGYFLTIAGGISERAGGGRAVVISRNLMLNSSSAYAGGTTINTGSVPGTSAANDVVVWVQNTQGLGLGNAEVKATGGLTSTLAIGVTGFDLGAGDTTHNVKVSNGGVLQLHKDTPVNLQFNGGTIAAAADGLVAGGALTDGGNMTFNVPGVTLTFGDTGVGAKAGSGAITLTDNRVWKIDGDGTVVFNGAVTRTGLGSYLMTDGNGTLRLNGANAIDKLTTSYGTGGTVVIGPDGTVPTYVALSQNSAYSVEKLNHDYAEVLDNIIDAKGVIALGANVELGSGITYNFDDGSSGDLSMLSLGAAKGKTIDFAGTLVPDMGVIYHQGNWSDPSPAMPGYSLGGGGGRLNVNVALPDYDPGTGATMTNLMIRGTELAPLPAGSVWLNAANTLTGEVQVTGNLVMGNANALANATRTVVFENGTIDLNNMGGAGIYPSGMSAANLIMLPNPGTQIQGGGLANSGGTLTGAVLQTLFDRTQGFDYILGGANEAGTTTIEAGALAQDTLDKGLRKVGVDTVTLLKDVGTADNNYLGETKVFGGTLVVPDVAVLGAATAPRLRLYGGTAQITATNFNSPIPPEVPTTQSWAGEILFDTQIGYANPALSITAGSSLTVTGGAKLSILNGAKATLTGGGTLDTGAAPVTGSTGASLDITGGATLITQYVGNDVMAGSGTTQDLFNIRDTGRLYIKSWNAGNSQGIRLGSIYAGGTLQSNQWATGYRITGQGPILTFNVDPADYEANGSLAFSSPDKPYKIVIDSGSTFNFAGDTTANDGPFATAAFQDNGGAWHRPVAYIEKSGAGTLNGSKYAYNAASGETRILNWFVKEGTLSVTGSDGALGGTASQWISNAGPIFTYKDPNAARQHLDGITVGSLAQSATLSWRGTQGFLPPSLYGGLPAESGTGFVEDKFVVYSGSTLRGSDATLVLGYTDGVDNYLCFPTVKGTGPTDIPVLNLNGSINFRSGIKLDPATTNGSRADVNVMGGVAQFTGDLANGYGRADGTKNDAPAMDMIRNLNVQSGEAVIYNNHTTTATTISTGGQLTFAPTAAITYAGTVQNNGTVRASTGTTDLGATVITATLAIPSVSYTNGALLQEFYTGLNNPADVGGAGRILGPMAGVGFDKYSPGGTNYNPAKYWWKAAGRIDYPGNATTTDGISPWIEPDGTQTKDNLGNDLPVQPNDLLGFRATGQIRIDTAGTYTFQSRSDDGSMLWMDTGYGWQTVVNYDGDHGWGTKTGTAYLLPGYYDLAYGFYENGGNAGFDLMWSTPTSGMALIPDSQFRYTGTSVAESVVQVDAGATLNAAGISGMYKTYASGTLNITNDVTTAILGVGPVGTATMASLTGNGTAAAINVAAGGNLGITGAATNINKVTIAGTAGMASLTGAGTNPTTTVISTGTLNITNAAGTGLSGMSSLAVIGTLDSKAQVSASDTVVGTTKVGTAVAGMLKAGAASSGVNLAIENGSADYAANDLVLSGTLTLGNVAIAPTYGYVPGLLEGRVASANNFTLPNPSTQNNPEAVRLSVVMGQTASKPPWGDNETWIYSGQFKASDTDTLTINWMTNIDDAGYVRLDGGTPTISNTSNVQVTGLVTLTPGWHNIEIRVGNGTGGAGATRGTPGVGFDLTGGTAFVIAQDPGNGSIFQTYVMSDPGEAATAGTLTAGVVTADVVNMISGTANVDGLVAHAAGATKTATVGDGTTLTVGTTGISGFNALTIDGEVAAGSNPVSAARIDVGAGSASAKLTSGAVTASDEFRMHAGTATVGAMSGGITGTGKVTVDAGQTLTVNGEMSKHSQITVNTGSVIATTGGGSVTLTGLLTGPGTVNLPITIDAGGAISPGASPGTMNTVEQTWKPGGVYLWEICDVAGAAGGNPGWDKLSITGDLNLEALTASSFIIDIASLTHTGGDLPGQADGYVVGTEYAWTIASATSITGFNAANFAFNTADWTGDLGSKQFMVEQSGTDLILALRTVITTDVRTWQRTVASGLWSDASSWDLGVPGTANPAVFGAKDTTPSEAILLTADASAKSITFEEGDWRILATGAEKLNVAEGIASMGAAGSTNTIGAEVVFGGAVGAIAVNGDATHNLSLLAALNMGGKALIKNGIGKLTAADVTADSVMVNEGSMQAGAVTTNLLGVNAQTEIASLQGTGVMSSVLVAASQALTVTGAAGISGVDMVNVEGTLAAGANPVSTTATGQVAIGMLATGHLTAGEVRANSFIMDNSSSATVAKLTGVGTGAWAFIAAGTTFTQTAANDMAGWQDITVNSNVDTLGGAINATGTVFLGNGATLTAGDVTAGTFMVQGTANVGAVNVGNTTIQSTRLLTAASHTGDSLTVHGAAGYSGNAILTGTATVGNGIDAATLNAAAVLADSLTIHDQAIVTTGAGTSKINTLTFDGDTVTPAGQWDITKGWAVLDGNNVDPYGSLRELIAAGYNYGDWMGQGIASTVAAYDPGTFAVGYADNAALIAPYNDTDNLFHGVAVDPAGYGVVAGLTLLGDLDLNGKVDGNDVTIFLLNYNQGAGFGWWEGDIVDQNGQVDGNDVTYFLLNYGQNIDDVLAGYGLGEAQGGVSSLGAVPEPATLALLGLGLAAMAARRRRAAK